MKVFTSLIACAGAMPPLRFLRRRLVAARLRAAALIPFPIPSDRIRARLPSGSPEEIAVSPLISSAAAVAYPTLTRKPQAAHAGPAAAAAE